MRVLAQPAAGHLGLEVPPAELGHAHVGQEEVAHALVQYPAVVQLDGRDADPFLEDADRIAGKTPRVHAADVPVMPACHGVGHQPLAE